MIPKKIHYCWFGGKPFPKLVKKCMESWERYCPDYQVIRWDESNSPLKDNLYVRQAYQAKKWAFVSDYVRLKALSEYGGIYLDTDVELFQSLDQYLNHEAFLGFECPEKVATCVIGAVVHHPFIERITQSYSERVFQRLDGSLDETTNVIYMTQLLADQGLYRDGRKQTVGGVCVYPAEYFSPRDLETGKLAVTPNTTAIHHFQASWMTPRQRFHTRVAQIIGPKYTRAIKRMLGREL